MTGSQTSHLTLTCRDSGVEITSIYAVKEDIRRDLDRHEQKPTGKDLQAWLESKGCQLDSSGSPAYLKRYADGSTVKKYYRDGKLHRKGGPAEVRYSADGSTVDEYYCDGKRHREGGPAAVWRPADGSTIEEYYRDGKLQRDDGPAFVRRFSNGSTQD